MGKKQVTSAAAKVANKAKTAKKTEQKKPKRGRESRKEEENKTKLGAPEISITKQGRNSILNIKTNKFNSINSISLPILIEIERN